MKGIIFTGCSFTYGHGLWYYSKDENIYSMGNNIDYNILRPIHLKHLEYLRFPRIVANHFNKFELVKNITSGDDILSMEVIDMFFGEANPRDVIDENDVYNYDEISHIVFQLTYPDRVPYIKEDGSELYINHENLDDVYEYMKKVGEVDVMNLEFNRNVHYYNLVEQYVQKYESMGISVILLCMIEETYDYFNFSSNISHKLCDIYYNGTVYKDMKTMMDENYTLQIAHDYDFFGDFPPQDIHPSKKCHEIIANSIIKKITEDENSTSNG